MEQKKQCLIITATIQPNSNFVAQTSIKDRRDEYLKVLEFYANNFSGDIFFVENSSYHFSNDEDFSNLFKLKRIQLVEFPKSTEVEKGKGYQEFEVLDFMVSKLANNYDEFIKVSGRYLTANFVKLIQQKNNGIIIDRHKKKNIAITSFFRSKVDVYQKTLKDCYQEVNDSKGIFVEHIVYSKLKHTDNKAIDLFNETPIYKGISGSYGGDLNRHPLKTKLRNMERYLLRLFNTKEFLIEY